MNCYCLALVFFAPCVTVTNARSREEIEQQLQGKCNSKTGAFGTLPG